MDTKRAQALGLGRGQTTMVYLRAGTGLLVEEGRVDVALTPPWLTAPDRPIRQLLDEGDYWEAPVSGWVQLEARQACTLAVQPARAATALEALALLTANAAGLIRQLTGRRRRPI